MREEQVHLGELHRVRLLFHAVASEVHRLAATDVVPVHVAGSLNEHAARSAGGVEKLLLAGYGLEDFDHVLDDRGGGVERAAVLSFGEGEVAEEVFVYLAEEVN